MIITGKHTGDFFGIPPTGNNFSYQAAHISRIADDKIVEHKAIRDDLRFMMQLGVIGAASAQYEPILNAWKGMMNKSVRERPSTEYGPNSQYSITASISNSIDLSLSTRCHRPVLYCLA